MARITVAGVLKSKLNGYIAELSNYPFEGHVAINQFFAVKALVSRVLRRARNENVTWTVAWKDEDEFSIEMEGDGVTDVLWALTEMDLQQQERRMH